MALFGVYAATLGLDASAAGDYGQGEAHRLLTAESIVSDGDLDLADEYRGRKWSDWYEGELRPEGRLTDGRRDEPHENGLAFLIAPAYAAGGPVAAELEVAALAALAFVLAAALARRLVPEPWATAAPLVVAVSPPALAYSTALYPEMPAAAALAAACLLALRARDRPRVRTAAAAAAPLAALPWLGAKYVPAGAVVALALVAWMLRRRQGLAALVAVEVVVTSGLTVAAFNHGAYGGLTPFAALPEGASPTGAASAADYPARATRFVGLLLDREVGLLRWAPFLALAGVGTWMLWRSRREHVARAVPEHAGAEVAATLLCAVAAAQLVVAALLAPSLFGPWFGGRQLVAALPVLAALSAWGLQRAPRVGTVLAVVTVAASAWLYGALALGGDHWIAPSADAPWGPLERALPTWAGHTVYADVVAIAAAAALAALAAREWARRGALVSARSPV